MHVLVWLLACAQPEATPSAPMVATPPAAAQAPTAPTAAAPTPIAPAPHKFALVPLQPATAPSRAAVDAEARRIANVLLEGQPTPDVRDVFHEIEPGNIEDAFVQPVPESTSPPEGKLRTP